MGLFKYIFIITLLYIDVHALPRACCAGESIYKHVNNVYKEVNKDLMAAEVLIKMYNDETLHTIDIANNRIDEKKGVDYYEHEFLDKEVASTHKYYKTDPLPEEYDLNQIVKIAVIRSIWYDKMINASLDKNIDLSEMTIEEQKLESDMQINQLKDELIEISEILRMIND